MDTLETVGRFIAAMIIVPFVLIGILVFLTLLIIFRIPYYDYPDAKQT